MRHGFRVSAPEGVVDYVCNELKTPVPAKDIAMNLEIHTDAELRRIVKRALELPSLDAFKYEIEKEINHTVEIRGANPVLEPMLATTRSLRLSVLNLRKSFWIRFVTQWTDDYAQCTEDQGTDAVAHLWRGLMGQRLTPEQRPLARQLAMQAGLVETAKSMCTAAAASPVGGAVDAVFTSFAEHCRKTVEARHRQGLPVPVVKHPRPGTVGIRMSRRFLQALGIGDSRTPAVDGSVYSFFRRRRARTRQSTMPLAVAVNQTRTPLAEGGLVEVAGGPNEKY